MADISAMSAIISSIATGTAGELMSQHQKTLMQMFERFPDQSFEFLLAMAVGQGDFSSLSTQVRSVAIVTLKKQAEVGEPAFFSTLSPHTIALTQNQLLQAFATSPDPTITRMLEICIGSVAEVSLFTEASWPELFPFLFSCFTTQCVQTNEHIPQHAMSLIARLIKVHFESLLQYLQQLIHLIHFIFDIETTTSVMEQLPMSQNRLFQTRINALQVLCVICAMPEFDIVPAQGQVYWSIITSTINTTLQQYDYTSAQTIISSLIDIFVGNGETDLFDINISTVLTWAQEIIKSSSLESSFRQSVLELLITYAENNQSFPLDVIKPAKKSVKTAPKKQPSAKRQIGQQFLLTLLDVTFFSMQNVFCSTTWVMTYDTNENKPDLQSTTLYNQDGNDEDESWHQTGMFVFCRLINLLAPYTVTTIILPSIQHQLQLPIVTLTQLTAQLGFSYQDNHANFLSKCLETSQYNTTWKEQVAALTALGHIFHPNVMPFNKSLLSTIFQLCQCAHPQVQYVAFTTLSTVISEYGSELLSNDTDVVPLLETITSCLTTAIADFHAPAVQQIACFAFQFFLDLICDCMGNQDGKNRDGINTFFSEQTMGQLVHILFSIFHHPVLQQKPDAVGLQLALLPCLAQLAGVNTIAFLPLLNDVLRLVAQILDTTKPPSSSSSSSPSAGDQVSVWIRLQCKAIECKSFLLHSLFQYATTTSSQQNTSNSNDNNTLEQTVHVEAQTFAMTIVNIYLQLAPADPNAIDFHTQVADREQLLKFILRALSRIAIILGHEQIHVILPFIMSHLLPFFELSMQNAMGSNLSFDEEFAQNKTMTSTSQITQAASILGQNTNDDSTQPSAIKNLNRLEQLDVLYEDISVALSMLEVYINVGSKFMLPWVYKITQIVLFFSNFPQNAEIQRAALAILPGLVSSLHLVLHSNITSLQHVSQPFSCGPVFPPSTTDPAHRSTTIASAEMVSFIQDNDIAHYDIYSNNPYFVQSIQSTLAQHNTAAAASQRPPALPAPCGNQIIDLLQLDAVSFMNSLDTSIFDQQTHCGPEFTLPTRLQATRLMIYIIQYIFYLLQLETDCQLMTSLLSCLGLMNDELSFVFINLSQCDILYRFAHFAQLISTTAHNKVIRHVVTVFARVARAKHNHHDDDNDDYDDDDNDDDDQPDDENDNNDGDNTTKGQNTTDNTNTNESASNTIYKTNFEILPAQQLPPSLIDYYGYYPLDETTLSAITDQYDFLSEQSMILISKIVQNMNTQVKYCWYATFHDVLVQQQIQPSENDSNFILCVPIVGHFAHILRQLFEFVFAEPTIASSITNNTNPACIPYNTPRQYLFSTQRLPFMLGHSFFQTFTHRSSILLTLANMQIVPHIMFSTAITALERCHMLLQTYVGTYSHGFSKEQILSLHSFNVGILLEHLGYMLGLLIHYAAPLESLHPQFHTIFNAKNIHFAPVADASPSTIPHSLISFPSLLPPPSTALSQPQTRLLSTQVMVSLIVPTLTLFSQTAALMKLYASKRYRRSYRSFARHFYPAKTTTEKVAQQHGVSPLPATVLSHLGNTPAMSFLDEALPPAASHSVASLDARVNLAWLQHVSVLSLADKDNFPTFEHVQNDLGSAGERAVAPIDTFTTNSERFFFGLDNITSAYIKATVAGLQAFLALGMDSNGAMIAIQLLSLQIDENSLHIHGAPAPTAPTSPMSQLTARCLLFLFHHLTFIMFQCLPLFRDFGEVSTTFHLLSNLFNAHSSRTLIMPLPDTTVINLVALPTAQITPENAQFNSFYHTYSSAPTLLALLIQATIIHTSSISSNSTSSSLPPTAAAIDNMLLLSLACFIRGSTLLEVAPTTRMATLLSSKLILTTLFAVHHNNFIPVSQTAQQSLIATPTLQTLLASNGSAVLALAPNQSFQQTVVAWYTSTFLQEILPNILLQLQNSNGGGSSQQAFTSLRELSNIQVLTPPDSSLIITSQQDGGALPYTINQIQYIPDAACLALYMLNNATTTQGLLIKSDSPFVIVDIPTIYLSLLMLGSIQ